MEHPAPPRWAGPGAASSWDLPQLASLVRGGAATPLMLLPQPGAAVAIPVAVLAGAMYQQQPYSQA